MKIFFTILGFSLLVLVACSNQKTASGQAITQGITGFVREKSGNQQPSPDIPESPGKALQTTIYVYETTNTSQVVRSGSSPFYDSILTRFITKVESDEKGHFVLDLPVGNYSLFTKVNGRFYANSFDVKNNIAPVEVKEKQVSEVNITISAGATY